MNPEFKNKQKVTAFRRFLRGNGMIIFFVSFVALTWSIFDTLFLDNVDNLSPSISELFSNENRFFLLRDFFEWMLKSLCQTLGFYQLSSSNIRKYGWGPSLWLIVIRLQSLVFTPLLLQLARSFLFSRIPALTDEIDENFEDCSNEYKQGARLKEKIPKASIHCLCIRILTRGDKNAHPLIRTAVTAAVQLFSQVTNCKHLKVIKTFCIFCIFVPLHSFSILTPFNYFCRRM